MDQVEGTRLALLFSLAALLALAWMLWRVARQAREHDPVLRAWRRLGARYARLGLGREPHEPAHDWVRRVLAARPHDAALAALGARFSDWRYADGQEGQRRSLLRELRRYRPQPR